MSEPKSDVPYGYCHCGCGKKTPLAKKTRKERGHLIHEPLRYLTGHHRFKEPAPAQGSKRCRVCGEVKPLTDFHRVHADDRTALRREGQPLLSEYQGHCRACTLNRVQYWRSRNPERSRELARATKFRKKFGITLADYDRMFAAQGGRCAICRQPETALNKDQRPKPLSVDHCHATGAVRALLCARCNVAIGMLNDDLDLFAAAIAYLKRHAP